MPAVVVAADGARVEKTFVCSATPRVSVSNPPGGVVVVRGWDKSEVHAVCLTVSPKVGIDFDPMPATGDAEKVRFTTRILDPQAAPHEKAVRYELDIPIGASLDIFNPSGSITVERVSGDEWVESVNASVSIRDGSGHTSVNSLNGDVELVRPSGRVEATSIMGNLSILASRSLNLRAQTQSGNLVFDGDFEPMGDYVLMTYRGNMDITCPTSNSLELRARTVRGKVYNDLPKLRRSQQAATPAPGNALVGVQNRGDATVELKSYSGVIHIRPRQ